MHSTRVGRVWQARKEHRAVSAKTLVEESQLSMALKPSAGCELQTQPELTTNEQHIYAIKYSGALTSLLTRLLSTQTQARQLSFNTTCPVASCFVTIAKVSVKVLGTTFVTVLLCHSNDCGCSWDLADCPFEHCFPSSTFPLVKYISCPHDPSVSAPGPPGICCCCCTGEGLGKHCW